MGGKAYSFTDDDSDDDKAVERSYTFVEDDAPAPSLSAETRGRVAASDKSGGNVFSEPDPTGAVGGGDQSGFDKWFGGVSKKLDLSPNPDDKENYYDYRGFYDAMNRGEVKSPDQPGGHWDSRFKSPDHPRAYLLDPETGRFFDTKTGNYTGGTKELVPDDRMDRLNKIDTPDLAQDQWAAAKNGADRPPPPPDDRPGWLKALTGSLPGSVMSDAADMPAVRGATAGLSHGLVAGLDQNLPGGDKMRELRRDAANDAPGVYAGADAVGALISPLNFGKTLAGNMLSSAVQGGARDYSDADPEQSVRDRAVSALSKAADDAGATAVIGGGLHAIGAGASSVLDNVAEGATKAGLRNRVAATGLYGAQMRDLAENKGEQYIQDLGQRIEDAGLHKGKGLFGWAPQPAETYKNNAQALNALGGTGMRDAEQGLSQLAAPPSVNTQGIVDDLRKGGAEAGRMIDPAGAQEAAFRGQVADNLQNAGGDWQTALANRRYLDQNINWNQRGGYEGAGMQDQVRRDVANDLRGEVSDALDRGVDSGNVPQDLATQWQQGRDNYALGAEVMSPALKRTYQEAGNQPISLPSWAMGAGGFAAGGIPGALATTAATQLLKTRGRSAMAGTLGAIGGAAESVQPGVQWMADQAPTAVREWQALSRDGVPAAPSGGQSDAYQQAQTGQDSRGNMLGANIDAALKGNSQILGSYADRFADVDDEERSALAERLARTDPDFKPIYARLTGASR